MDVFTISNNSTYSKLAIMRTVLCTRFTRIPRLQRIRNIRDKFCFNKLHVTKYKYRITLSTQIKVALYH